MMIVKRYELKAGEGRLEELLACLEQLATSLMRRDGCCRVEIDASVSVEDILVFSEYWRDKDALLASAVELNRALIARIVECCCNMTNQKFEQVRVYRQASDRPSTLFHSRPAVASVSVKRSTNNR